MSIPKDLKYTKEHEWVKDLGDGTMAIGITDHAQDALGDIVYVELPEIEDEFTEDETLCTVESVKAVSDILAPFSCAVIEVNEELEDTPEAINADAYESWIIKVGDIGKAELMSAEEYEEFLAKE